MSKQATTQKLVPKLRFPEFENAGEWEVTLLNKITKRVILKNKNGAIIRVFTNSAINGIVNQRDYFDKDIANKNNLENYYIVEPNDYIYNPRISNVAPVGPLFKNKTNKIGVMSPLYMVFRFNEKNNDFYEYYFMSSHWYRSIKKVANKGARSDRISITASIFMNIKILKPPLLEQQKIADCLSSLDDLITTQTKKLTALQQHKKGLMQNLFPADGKTTPKLRFPEFSDKEDWTSSPLENLYSFKITNSLSREKLNYEFGSIKNIHYGDIHTKFSTLFDIEREITPFINPSESLDKIKPESYCIEGDLIFADASEDIDDVGKSIEIINLNNEKLLSGLHTLLARQIDEIFIVGFIGYLFKSSQIRKQIKKESQGAKVLGISARRLLNININYPSDKKEQQKIADCLSSLDDLITTQTKKLTALQQHKKGLMQNLFPY